MKKTWFMVFFRQKTPKKQAVIYIEMEGEREKDRKRDYNLLS